MARRKRKETSSLAELEPSADPAAPIDGAAFLAHAQPVLGVLAKDLAERAEASEAATSALKARWKADKEAGLTADAFSVYLTSFVDQVAASWLLACVFVRTLEDRGLLEKNRIGGPGASDSLAAFRRLAPYLNERDYLLHVFAEVAVYPAVAGVFDRKHALFWQLSPGGEAARELLGLFNAGRADEPHYRFGQPDTRLLGDLYQDLNEAVRKRFALLQTPRFVESFILDRTLEPAIEKFGLDEVTVFDPTCGSGHFLLGAFERLVEHRKAAEPGRGAREIAELALRAVYGADLNPYAVAIARFRLILAYLDEGAFDHIGDAPKLELNLVVANSLLHNPKKRSLTLENVEGVASGEFLGDKHPLTLDDPQLAAKVFGKGHAAVVGNPPYITEKDKARRDKYRDMYDSAAGKYALAAPFTEAFFDYGRVGAFVGMINANSFMKREFGKKLIEEVLRNLDLTAIINTAGAYIPGHGTPTVLLFGTADAPQSDQVLTVLANRGEPSTPADPEKGEVWGSIAAHVEEIGFENDYITVRRTNREDLRLHPWSLAGGGATELKTLLEERSEMTLGAIAEDIGFASFTGMDDAFLLPDYCRHTLRLADLVVRPLVSGEHVRDWSIESDEIAITPYDKHTQQPLSLSDEPWARFLWRLRTPMEAVISFAGKTRKQLGEKWWEWYRWQDERYRASYRITYAEVATHNHFVLDRGGKVFKQTAPIIKLPEDATEDDHLALLAYLNSSTACFWMKQVCYPKGTHSEARPEKGIPEDNRYAFSGTALSGLPLPDASSLKSLGRALDAAAVQREQLQPAAVVQQEALTPERVAEAEAADRKIERRMVAVQEDLDWAVYERVGLAEGISCRAMGGDVGLGPHERPYLAAKAPAHLAAGDRAIWLARKEAVEGSRELGLLETPVFKRRWWGARGVFAHKVATYSERCRDAAAEAVADAAESVIGADAAVSSRSLVHSRLMAQPRSGSWLRYLAESSSLTVAGDIMAKEAVPFLAALRHTPAGMKKHSAWDRTWERQRREDDGESVGAIPVPPKYTAKDFQQYDYYRLRGKLDVPKERFISYPGCESDEDGEPVYGWAGWDHLERAQALWNLYRDRKEHEGWDKERLVPMLSGLLELMPWLHQWHSEPNEDGFKMNEELDNLLTAECHDLDVTREELAAWRPPERKAGRRKPKNKKSDA